MALSDGVIVAYHLDSGALETDSGPNSLTLTNTNSVVTATGKLAEGADFERSSSQKLSRADNALFEVTSLSVSFWMKAESWNDYGATASRWSDNTPNRCWAIATFSDGKLYAYHSTDGSGNAQINNGSALSTATWYHVVVTYDETDTSTGKKIYIDGTNVASGVVGALFTGSNADFVIGDAVAFAGGSAFFDGVIDELVIWDRALSGAEVTSLYNGGTGLAYPFTAAAATRGTPFGSRGTAFNGGRVFQGVIR